MEEIQKCLIVVTGNHHLIMDVQGPLFMQSLWVQNTGNVTLHTLEEFAVVKSLKMCQNNFISGLNYNEKVFTHFYLPTLINT